jgi:hypothetical protein
MSSQAIAGDAELKQEWAAHARVAHVEITLRREFDVNDGLAVVTVKIPTTRPGVQSVGNVRVTGEKAEQKRYFRHTGYMGHERFVPFSAMLEKHPERVIEKAVYGMLPKTALGRQKLRGKLRVFADSKHTHAAQQPKVLDLKKGEK